MKTLYLSLFILLFLPLKAQFPYYTHYTINDGLASNKVYNIIEDRNGFIWLCTDQGVSRFDGVSFATFTVKDGLPDNEVLNLFEDAVGRVWFNGFSTEPCYYFKGKIYNAENDSFIQRIKDHKPNGMCLSVIVQYNNSIAYHIIENGKKLLIGKEVADVEINKDGELAGNLYQHILTKGDNICRLYSSLGVTEWYIGGPLKTPLIYQPPHRMNYTKTPARYYFELDVLKSVVNKFDLTTGKSQAIPVDPVYNNIFVNERHITLIGEKTFKVFNSEFKSDNEVVMLPFTFERIYIDRKGNKWLGSFDNGLYFIRKHAPDKIMLPEGKSEGVLLVVSDKEDLYLNTEKNGLLALDNKGKLKEVLMIPSMRRMRGYAHCGNERIVGTDNGLYRIGKDFNSAKLLKYVAIKDIETEDNVTALIGAAGGAYIYGVVGIDSVLTIDKTRTTALYRVSENEIWLGGVNGIRSCIKKGNEYVSAPLQLVKEIDNSRIVDIKRDKKGNIWVATDQRGLFMCVPGGAVIRFSESAFKEHRLLSDICLQILVSDDNRVFVATLNGISIVSYGSGTMRFNVVNYSATEGMPGKTIKSIAFHNGNIIVATPDGLYSFHDLPEANNETGITTITRIRVNSEDRGLSRTELGYKENNLIITYASSFINTGTGYHFIYRVPQLNKTWIHTNTLEVPLLGLEPGEYTFEIAAINLHGIPGKVAVVRFKILNPWFKTWWFIGIVLLVIILAAMYYYRLTRERIAMGKNLTLLRLRVLRAQMNPHFVFNALSNIQHLIQIKHLDNADVYIEKLSKIMRNSIDYSAKEFIQLDKEIDYTRNYIEIEKMRFGDKFDYEIKIEVSEQDRQSIFVPPLILQPMAENAIKHAFKGIDRKGQLNIIITQPDQNILCYTITDNGCGFKNPTYDNKASHGLDITRERLTILFKNMNKRSGLTLKSGENKGTTIIIEMPLIKD